MSDLMIEGYNVFIEDAIAEEVLTPAIEDFVAGYDGSYGHAFDATRRSVLDESDESRAYETSAYFIPAVRFVTHTGLAILEHEGVAYQLPGKWKTGH